MQTVWLRPMLIVVNIMHTGMQILLVIIAVWV